jgi:hypothetical protein
VFDELDHAGERPESMSWSTISASCSNGVFAKSTSSFGAHW